MQIQDRTGEQFGNYRLKRLIGKGGYAEVYLAEHIHLNTLQPAIKVLTGTNLKDYQQDEFLREARTVANLQHLNPHIVQIRDFGIQASKNGVDSDIPYIVMEYASEGTLQSLYPYGTKVSLERIIFYVNQIAEALQCAHDQKPPIVHRDIKPANMLLRSIDHILLSDFGIAVAGNTGPHQALPVKEKGAVGTASYMAPERLSGHTRRASDQYSLGIVVYEWLCGSRPFDGTDKEICYQHLAVQPPPLYLMYPHVTQEIEKVVMRALAKKPEERYPTVQAFAHALEIAAEPALQQSHLTQQPTAKHIRGQLISTTEPVTSLPIMSSGRLAGKPARPLSKKIRDFFELSPQFARDRRYSFFRTIGTVLNILSALTIGWLWPNPYIMLGGWIFPVLIFALCVRAIEEKLAIFFGIMVALYWGGVGWVLGSFIASLLDRDRLFLSIFIGLIFSSSSLGLHIWYVSHKNS